MNPKTLVHLTTNALEFSREGIKGSLKFEIADLVKNQEITDVRLLDKKLKEVSLMLSPEMTFQKIIPLTDAKDEKFETDKFLSDIPFDPPNIEVRSLRNETDLSFFAGNKHLFYPIVRILEKYGWTVLAVSPEDVEVNFLSLEEGQSQEKFSLNLSPKVLVLGAVFLLLLIISGITLFFSQNKPKTGPVEVPFSSVGPVASPSATIYKPKQDLRIQVLNGSGKEGDAAKVVTALEKLGYKNLETGNLDVRKATISAVLVKDTVDGVTKQEVVSALEKLFKTVIFSPASVSSSFDILIITGP